LAAKCGSISVVIAWCIAPLVAGLLPALMRFTGDSGVFRARLALATTGERRAPTVPSLTWRMAAAASATRSCNLPMEFSRHADDQRRGLSSQVA